MSVLQEISEVLAKSDLPDDCEYDGLGTIYAGRAHVAYISNHQSGERGRHVARFYAAAPRLLRHAQAEIEGLQREKAEFCGCRDLGDGTGTECVAHEEQRTQLEAAEARAEAAEGQLRKALPFARELRLDASGEQGRMSADRMYKLADLIDGRKSALASPVRDAGEGEQAEGTRE